MTLKDKKELRRTIKIRLLELGKNQSYLSRVLKRSPQQISQALTGSQPRLLKKIENHLMVLENKQQINTQNNLEVE